MLRVQTCTNVSMNGFGLDRCKVWWRLWLWKAENLRVYLVWDFWPFVVLLIILCACPGHPYLLTLWKHRTMERFKGSGNMVYAVHSWPSVGDVIRCWAALSVLSSHIHISHPLDASLLLLYCCCSQHTEPPLAECCIIAPLLGHSLPVSHLQRSILMNHLSSLLYG